MNRKRWYLRHTKWVVKLWKAIVVSKIQMQTFKGMQFLTSKTTASPVPPTQTVITRLVIFYYVNKNTSCLGIRYYIRETLTLAFHEHVWCKVVRIRILYNLLKSSCLSLSSFRGLLSLCHTHIIKNPSVVVV